MIPLLSRGGFLEELLSGLIFAGRGLGTVASWLRTDVAVVFLHFWAEFNGFSQLLASEYISHSGYTCKIFAENLLEFFSTNYTRK